MNLSYIILTYNRKDQLLGTLDHIHRHTPPPPGRWDTWVVDNGSTDGSAQAVKQAYDRVQVIRRPINEGIWARQYAIDQAAGQYLCFLDDDSYPVNDAVAESIRFLDRNPTAGAVTGSLLMNDGSREASALPAVPAIGAWCARRRVLEQAGGLRPCRSFIRQAEEYDLAFRILESGHTLHRYENIVYRHEKRPGARSTPLIHRLDMRNNLIILHRYVPQPLRRAYGQDWTQRYAAIAKHRGFAAAARGGRWAASWHAVTGGFDRRPASTKTIETIFGLAHQAQTVAAWSVHHNVRRVVIADFSKNIYATYQACLKAGLQIESVADNHAAFAGLEYRGLPLLRDADAIGRLVDGIVLSNINPAQTDRRLAELQKTTDLPVLRLWHGLCLAATDRGESCHAVVQPAMSNADTA